MDRPLGPADINAPTAATHTHFCRHPLQHMPFSATLPATFSLSAVDEVSETKDIARVPWRVLKRIVNGFVELYANANADNESRMWSCDASVEFRILTTKDKVLFEKNTGVSHFKANGSHLCGFKRLISVDSLRDHFPEGSFRVETHITVQRMTGVRVPPVFSFDPSPLSDCALVVENQELWVSRNYLALYSPYFDSLFFGDFVEHKMDSVEIPDVSHDEFVDFLRVIYPSHKEVTEDNVESLLRLADRFDVPFVTERCEDFLLTTDHFSLAEKLLISGQFQLCRLENQCLKEVNSLADLRHVSEAPEAALLTDFTKVSLYERMVRLSKEREEATVPLPPRPSAISYKVTHTPSFVF